MAKIHLYDRDFTMNDGSVVQISRCGANAGNWLVGARSMRAPANIEVVSREVWNRAKYKRCKRCIKLDTVGSMTG